METTFPVKYRRCKGGGEEREREEGRRGGGEGRGQGEEREMGGWHFTHLSPATSKPPSFPAPLSHPIESMINSNEQKKL